SPSTYHSPPFSQISTLSLHDALPICALPDPVDAQLAQKPLRRVRAHVTAAAERLDTAVGAPVRRLARKQLGRARPVVHQLAVGRDRKSTRLNSSHRTISYAVFCLKKK